MAKKHVTFAVCTYNRANRLSDLLDEMLSQESTLPYEILIVENNCTDNTIDLIKKKMKSSNGLIRFVSEPRQGIVFARNRAIEESLGSDYLVFIDDDELPCKGFLQAAIDAFLNHHCDVVGGKIQVNFENKIRPKWLTDDLLIPLAAINYGDTSFFITDKTTPLWTSNIAYNTKIFKKGLRFNLKYNREGYDVGGGEDWIMFTEFIDMGIPVMYQPSMATNHFIEAWRVKRRYFYKLYYRIGYKEGLWNPQKSEIFYFGIPRYAFGQLLHSIFATLKSLYRFDKRWLKKSLKMVYFIGIIMGYFKKNISHS
ncbi:MAG: glycosyltransferase family 2 protein [Proteobacteria bacterium]|nr:glycosyltransferase family 2 protein [Pseudomonadota bacterium]MBU1583956.1 glycosyltransferase family 2 protein [Pseudomonadota bacterium]